MSTSSFNMKGFKKISVSSEILRCVHLPRWPRNDAGIGCLRDHHFFRDVVCKATSIAPPPPCMFFWCPCRAHVQRSAFSWTWQSGRDARTASLFVLQSSFDGTGTCLRLLRHVHGCPPEFGSLAVPKNKNLPRKGHDIDIFLQPIEMMGVFVDTMVLGIPGRRSRL